jgi:hypothetical protein
MELLSPYPLKSNNHHRQETNQTSQSYGSFISSSQKQSTKPVKPIETYEKENRIMPLEVMQRIRSGSSSRQSMDTGSQK